MTFDALTNFNKIDVGTSFLIIENPTTDGTSPRKLYVNDEVMIILNDGKRTHIKSEIIRVGAADADIRLPDGSVWQMTPHTRMDPPVGIKADWAHRQSWVVRSIV